MNILKSLFSLFALLTLVGCGGGGSNAGTSIVGGGTQGSKVEDLVLVLSAASVANTGGSTVTLKVTALDVNRNALAASPIKVSVDSNAVITPDGSVTDASGILTATIGVGADSTPRNVTITASSGSVVRTAVLQVTNQTVSGSGTLELALSSTSVSAAVPATVTATLKDASNKAIAGQVVTFDVTRSLAATNVKTALTDSAGRAVVILVPTSTTGAGADEVTVTATVGGSVLKASKGFQVQATNVSLDSFASAVPALSAYGQTTLTLTLSGVSVGSPVQISVTSACVALGKAVLSPSTFTSTTATVSLQYRDNGCGAVQASDQLQATIVGTASSRTLTLPIAAPSVSSLAFIDSKPEVIYLRGSGFAEAAIVTFEVRDAAGNPLPNRNIVAHLLTLTGGVTMEGGVADVVRISDALGRISIRVNSGTVPTPIRISATLQGTSISTVSSNLSVAVGLPSQLNFSLSQGTKNIEGYNIDGVTNTYQILAADRNGNPVPVGTSINFITEGGQIEPIKRTQLSSSGIAVAVANFVSQSPRPLDGRVTITSYALGEESFLDLNGNNTWDTGEPFQDLGNIFKDRLFDGAYDPTDDEYVPLVINNRSACTAPGNPLLTLDGSIPSMPSTCDGIWSGAGQVYVRRATETVFSTSAARPLWANTSGLEATCLKIPMQIGPAPTNTAVFTLVNSSDVWSQLSTSGALSFIVADANPLPRLNPMAAGTVITATTPTVGMTVSIAGGSPVPSTLEASGAAVTYSFTDTTVKSGIVLVTFKSPSGLSTTFGVTVKNADRTSACL